MTTFKFKLSILLPIIAVLVFAFFIYTALGGTFINKTLKTNPDLERGLVGHWTFDGKDMLNNVADISGQGNTGYLNGQTSTTTAIGVIGQALSFDGVDDYVDVGTVSTYNFERTDPFSISVWINMDALPQFQYRFLGRQSNTGGYNRGYILQINSDGHARFNLVSTAGNVASIRTTGTPFSSIDTWHYITVTYDGSSDASGMQIYANGVVQAKTILSNTLSATTQDATIPFQIGVRDSVANFFSGFLDDVRIYNRALSANEISRLYDIGATTYINKTLKTNPDLERGLVGHWTFDGKDMLNNVADISGQGNHGSLQGQTSTTTAVGKIGQALSFDGVDDSITVTDADDSLDGVTEITLSLWFYPRVLTSGWHIIAGKGSDVANYGLWHDGNRFVNVISSGGWKNHYTSNTYSADQWYHLVIVTNSNDNTMRIYVNGVDDTASPTETADMVVNNGDFQISPNYSGNRPDGLIDDVRIYNRALSANEISRLYDMGATTYINKTLKTNPDLESGLVGHWTFDGKDMLNNVADISGQGNHGYLQGQTSTTTAIGVIGQALLFDGVDDYVDMGDPASGDLDFGSNVQFSIGFWLNSAPADVNARRPIAKRMATGYLIQISTSNTIFRIDQGSNVDIPFIATIDDNAWHHIVVGRDAVNGFIYVDGQFDNSSAITIGTDLSTTANFIGGANFNGMMDDIRIYNRALSANEISRLYDMGR